MKRILCLLSCLMAFSLLLLPRALAANVEGQSYVIRGIPGPSGSVFDFRLSFGTGQQLVLDTFSPYSGSEATRYVGSYAWEKLGNGQLSDRVLHFSLRREADANLQPKFWGAYALKELGGPYLLLYKASGHDLLMSSWPLLLVRETEAAQTEQNTAAFAARLTGSWQDESGQQVEIKDGYWNGRRILAVAETAGGPYTGSCYLELAGERQGVSVYECIWHLGDPQVQDELELKNDWNTQKLHRAAAAPAARTPEVSYAPGGSYAGSDGQPYGYFLHRYAQAFQQMSSGAGSAALEALGSQNNDIGVEPKDVAVYFADQDLAEGDELILINKLGGYIQDIYTRDESGQVLHLVSGWARNRYYLRNDGVSVYREASGGATEGVWDTYRFLPGARGLELLERLESMETVQEGSWPTLAYYYTRGEGGNREQVTESRADELRRFFERTKMLPDLSALPTLADFYSY